jgi:hypothetical protein
VEPEGSLPHSQVPATFPYPEPARSSSYPPHRTSWRSTLILSSRQRLGLPGGLFPSGSPHQNPVYASHLPIRATCPAHLILDCITRTMLGEQYRSLSSSLCSFLHFPCHLVPLRPKYSPQHPILVYLQPTFLPQWIQDDRRLISS